MILAVTGHFFHKLVADKVLETRLLGSLQKTVTFILAENIES